MTELTQLFPRSTTPRADYARADLTALVTRLHAFDRRVQPSVFEAVFTGRRNFAVDTPIWSQDDVAENIAVIEEGFAYRFQIMPDGRRYVSDIYGPGAICNWSRDQDAPIRSDILFKKRTAVSLFGKDALREVFAETPGIETAILRHEHARALRASQRTRTLVVGQAPERFLHFLLDLKSEYAVAGLRYDNARSGMTQAEIADMLGITPVHLGRTIRSLLAEERVIRKTLTNHIVVRPEEESRSLAYVDHMHRPPADSARSA
ncbi:Crp/Fnr family transcriptional regulator [Aurantiacibacter spongiae]|uniref:Crp/Fnr family transcriptional regulator n=1 Tax=Aurantiacibacter spongiae TaxID=2488860 RepID=A0A3N5CSQ8_9SPHN|nr:Crp/Fnr family transcriptional regulator [Aurantiacibacter spongiae]RPF72174.1 Crp/Fnr family transcriptional regulator [Aurantiacibacter spongiae]